MGARSTMSRDTTRRTGAATASPSGGESITFWSTPLIQSAAAVAGAIDLWWFPSLFNLTPAGVVSPGVSFTRELTLRNLRLWYRAIGAPSLGEGEIQVNGSTFGQSDFLPAPGGSGSYLDFAIEQVVPAEEAFNIIGVWNQSTDDGAIVQSVLSFELAFTA
jgi:hypothetical protein